MKNLINYLKEPAICWHIIGTILWVVGAFIMAFAFPKDVDIMTKNYFFAGYIIAIIGWWKVKNTESIIIAVNYMYYKMFENKTKNGETLTERELWAYNLMKDDKTMQRIDKIIEDNGKE